MPGPPYHPGGGPAGLPGAPSAPSFSPHCVAVPRRTCCLLLSALRPSLPLPLVVARVVEASLRRDLFQRVSCLPDTRRLRKNSPRFGFACSTFQPKEFTLGFLPIPATDCHHPPGPWPPHPQDCAPACRKQPWVSFGFGHGVLEVEASSPQAPAGFSL